MGMLDGLSTHPILVLLPLVALVYFLFKVYGATSNPISDLPGPTVSKWTNLRLKYAVLTGERFRYVHRLHQEYGPIIHISPDEVSVSEIEAAKTIFKMGSRFYKTDWYSRLAGMKANSLFTTTDPQWHGQHRRLTAANFSEKWIKNMEPYIARNVNLAVVRIKEEVKAKGYCDVFKWFTFMAN